MKRAEEHAQRSGDERGLADRGHLLGQARMVRALVRRRVRPFAAPSAHFGRRPRASRGRHGRTIDAGPVDGGADDVGDPIVDGALRGCEIVVVLRAQLGITQYAAGMIYEPQRLFNVALAVTRLCVIFSDLPAQRGAHLVIRGLFRNAECLIERGAHRLLGSATLRWLGPIFGEIAARGKSDYANIMESGPVGGDGRQSPPRHAPCRRRRKRAARERLPFFAGDALRRDPAPAAGHPAFGAFAVSFSRIRADLPERSRR